MYDFGRNPYASIRSMRDVRNFTEALIILPLHELISCIPEEILELIPPAEPKNFLIFVPGQLRPIFTFSNNDRILERHGLVYKQISLEDAFGRKDLYLDYRRGDTEPVVGQKPLPDGVFHFKRLFGSNFSWYPEFDKRLVSLVARIVALELSEATSNEPTVDDTMLPLESISGILSYDAWREFQLASGRDLSEGGEDLFNREVVDAFRFIPNSIRDTIQNAGMRYPDSDARVEICGSGIQIRFSIDKKLIPYYEKKFDETY